MYPSHNLAPCLIVGGILAWLFCCPLVLASTILSDVEKGYLKVHEPIKFVSQSQYAPFEFINSQGTRDGMSIELVRWIATELGFKAQFFDTSFAKAQQMVQRGDADVLTSFFYSKKRSRYFDFTHTIFDIPATLFIPSARPDLKDINDLIGKTIAIQKGDYAEDFLREQQIKFNVLHTSNFAEAVNKVITGEADAVIGDEQIVLYYLYSNNLEKSLKKVGRPLYTGENAMAVVDGNNVLTSILNKGILLAQKRGVLKNINSKWLGSQLLENTSLLYRYRKSFTVASVIICTLLIIIWLWNIFLRREVQRRTMELLDKEEFLDTVIEHIPNMLFVKDAENLTYVKFNQAFEKMTGYDKKQLYHKTDYDLFPKELADFFINTDREVLNSKQPIEIGEDAIHTPNGVQRKLRTIKVPIIGERKRPSFLLGISEDITERLEMEKAREISEKNLTKALKEKETLLKEVHHRVKNNMQVISSLLRLQAQNIDAPELLDIFNEATGRIQVMALVHENLYQVDSLSEIPARNYLQNLISQLESIYVGYTYRINFQLKVEDVSLSIDEAIPLGLIVTELLTNSIKYAFPDRSNGTIKVFLEKHPDNLCELRICDDGIGLPDNVNPNNAETLGLRLIRDLIEDQLEGEWQVNRDTGVAWTIRW